MTKAATAMFFSLLIFGLSACGVGVSSPTPTKTIDASTNQILRRGSLAIGAVHRLIDQPYKSGDLTGRGGSNGKRAVRKAILAARFAAREVTQAVSDSRSDQLLAELLASYDSLAARLNKLAAKLKAGTVDAALIAAVDGEVANLDEAFQSATGKPVVELTPSGAQLAGG